LSHRSLIPALRGLAASAVIGGALAFAPMSGAQAGTLYIAVQEGVAIGGYDPVSFHLSEAPQKGRDGHALMWKGAVWLFQSAENQSRFEANPRAYAPRFGGHCAYGMAQGHVFDGSPLSWEIVDGRLYLFHTPRVEALWQAEHEVMIRAARAAWPDVLQRQ